MIESSLDSVVKAVPTSILVVIFRLGDRIIYINGGHFERTLVQHFIEAVHPCRGFFCDAMNALEHLWVFFMEHRGEIATVVQDHVGFPGFTVL